jgi:hypothetical protein
MTYRECLHSIADAAADFYRWGPWDELRYWSQMEIFRRG